MRLHLIALLATFASVTGSNAARAQQLDYDEIAKRPGFTVTRETSKGEEVVTIRKATVTIHIDKNTTTGMDQDTAVMCAWTIYVGLHNAADYCFPDSEQELKEDFADAVEHFKDFIVANSLSPVKRSDLDAYVDGRRKDLLARASTLPPGTPRCARTDMFTDYQKDGRAKRRADVAKILATPRPPVMNPCL